MKIKLAAAALALTVAAGATPVLAQEWSGFYVGVHGGFLDTDEDKNETLVFDRDFDGDFDDTVVLSGGTTNAFGPGFCSGQASTTTPSGLCDRDDGGVEGGARVGYDMQFGNWVVGVVGDIQGVDAEDSVTGFSTTPASYIFTRNLEHTAGLRARVGYATGPALVYATGGAAYGKIENRFYTSNGANSFTETVEEDDADGFQYGGGVEWRLAPSLTLVGEYLYTDLEAGEYVVRAGPGTAPATNPFILPPNTAGTDITRSNPDFKTHEFRLGMNVRF
ncbi:MAG TPA: outer membrane beta-barrel protein [Brevundimonas sp.]|jgi:outer membrane immunogenic protein|uniref:outer membrane protein n=1 Tax=Brevundimonas sp. TaxID=1871086 RepID=UPI002DF04DDB|nr:outer membrane beta-barrel protein [Brevundimonas sp.]